ncbi:uncharacterized protein LOC144166588 isoform X11 [Haemaphysalis longicornis]
MHKQGVHVDQILALRRTVGIHLATELILYEEVGLEETPGIALRPGDGIMLAPALILDKEVGLEFQETPGIALRPEDGIMSGTAVILDKEVCLAVVQAVLPRHQDSLQLQVMQPVFLGQVDGRQVNQAFALNDQLVIPAVSTNQSFVGSVLCMDLAEHL